MFLTYTGHFSPKWLVVLFFEPKLHLYLLEKNNQCTVSENIYMHHEIVYDMRLYVRYSPIVTYGPGREIYAFAMPRKIPATFETNWYCAFLFIFAPKVALLRVNLSFLDFQTKSCVRAALIRSINVMRVGSVIFCNPFIQKISYKL